MRMPASSAPITSAPASPVVTTSSTGASAAAASAYQPASEPWLTGAPMSSASSSPVPGEWQVLAGEQVGCQGQGPHPRAVLGRGGDPGRRVGHRHPPTAAAAVLQGCLLYTSDAADEEDSVDLGGRRIIKK